MGELSSLGVLLLGGGGICGDFSVLLELGFRR